MHYIPFEYELKKIIQLILI